MKVFLLILVIYTFFFSVTSVDAVYNPLAKPNNKFGIHILFPAEIHKAAELVNSAGGDWGYVTIPIQYSDRDLDKWQNFMDDAAKLHVIPILRIATDADHANTNVWRKPNEYDVVDFVNFLNSLSWPTQNKYVMVYNELNRNDEWGGQPPSPEEYADFLSYAINVFKSQSPDFFIIAAGLDNASPNDGVKYLDNFVYLRRMGQHNPDVFKKIDGFSSHSYPNPNFAQPPSKTKQEGTSTYLYEIDIIRQYAGEKKPVFITETGWNGDAVSEKTIAEYYATVMTEFWGQDADVIAVTPFILESNGGPYDKFSFIKSGKFTTYGQRYKDLAKVKGTPILNYSRNILAATSESSVDKSLDVGLIRFKPVRISIGGFSAWTKLYFKSIFQIGK